MPRLLRLLILLLALPGAARAEATDQSERLNRWFSELGSPLPKEAFGHYLARAARLQHGAPYDESLPLPARETLQVNLEQFECVSFIEASLAVARCGWMGRRNTACFTEELVASRYRGGEMNDYASRLHYFTEWIDDNATRARLTNLTEPLGGTPIQKDFFYISRRALHRPDVQSALDDRQLEQLTRKVTATEAALSTRPHIVLSREAAASVLGGLEDGDLVAFVRERPGMLVHHAGFVLWANGTPRLLHASSYHKRVVITVRDVTNYLLRRPERKGVIVARPLAP